MPPLSRSPQARPAPHKPLVVPTTTTAVEVEVAALRRTAACSPQIHTPACSSLPARQCSASSPSSPPCYDELHDALLRLRCLFTTLVQLALFLLTPTAHSQPSTLDSGRFMLSEKSFAPHSNVHFTYNVLASPLIVHYHGPYRLRILTICIIGQYPPRISFVVNGPRLLYCLLCVFPSRCAVATVVSRLRSVPKRPYCLFRLREQRRGYRNVRRLK